MFCKDICAPIANGIIAKHIFQATIKPLDSSSLRFTPKFFYFQIKLSLYQSYLALNREFTT